MRQQLHTQTQQTTHGTAWALAAASSEAEAGSGRWRHSHETSHHLAEGLHHALL